MKKDLKIIWPTTAGLMRRRKLAKKFEPVAGESFAISEISHDAAIQREKTIFFATFAVFVSAGLSLSSAAILGLMTNDFESLASVREFFSPFIILVLGYLFGRRSAS